LVFIALIGLVTCFVYAASGLLTGDAVALALILGPPFALAMSLGEKRFRFMSERVYRIVALSLIAVAVFGSIPISDSWLHWIFLRF